MQIILPFSDIHIQLALSESLKVNHHIGIVQVFPNDSKLFFQTGTLGKIVAIQEKDAYALSLIVEGIMRFDIEHLSKTDSNCYLAHASYEKYRHDIMDEHDVSLDRARLLQSFKTYYDFLMYPNDWDELKHCSDAKLLRTLLQICPFEPAERQCLIEAVSLQDQCELMIQMLELSRTSMPYPKMQLQ